MSPAALALIIVERRIGQLEPAPGARFDRERSTQLDHLELQRELLLEALLGSAVPLREVA